MLFKAFFLNLSFFIFNVNAQELGQYQAGDFLLKWRDLGDSVYFEFSTRAPSSDNFWSAFALSNDNSMVFIFKIYKTFVLKALAINLF